MKHLLTNQIKQRWPGQVQCGLEAGSPWQVTCTHAALAQLCGWLFLEQDFSFAGLVVEEEAAEWRLHYHFYGERARGWIQVTVTAPLPDKTFPSIVKFVHAADWHEREAEDLYGLIFEGHPQLGDFVLHNDAWQESVEPMRHRFDAQAAMWHRRPDADWRPRRIVHEPGAFVMPVGPVYSGATESVHFLLETVGEDVIRSTPRLFYKWRGIEKLAEGKTVEDVLLLAERFAATTAFAHGLAFCQAVEAVCETTIPARARLLRVFLAELERLRHHVGAIEGICASTALVVASSQAAILEEDLLRICCELTGHRYLFGLLAIGGLLGDLGDEACRKALERSRQALKKLNGLEQQLRVSSSFLDRLEEVGLIAFKDAKVYGLAGPVARASGMVRDLRTAQPYSGYEQFDFDLPREAEGDGYARLRVLFAEARQSVRIMEQAVAALPKTGQANPPIARPSQSQDGAHPAVAARPEHLKPSDVCASSNFRAGAAFGWVEAPRGAAFHWVRLDESGRIARYRIVPPSFANWHGFHLAVEKFAFQDFPIILSTFDLSVAENDR